MVTQLFVGLMLIAAASLLVTQGKRRRVWSIILLGALGTMAYFFVVNLNAHPNTGFIYQWLPYRQLKADFNISASLRMQTMLMSMLYLLAALVLNHILEEEENYSLHISVLNVLSFTAIILLASSHDFFQMMFASSLISLLGFYIPAQPAARRKFFAYSFGAEMAVFIALAIIYGFKDAISLGVLDEFAARGGHKDFVAILLALALGSKCALPIAGGHYQTMSGETQNRQAAIWGISVPLAGIIMLSKLHAVFVPVAPMKTVFALWCGAGAVLSVLGVLLSKSKGERIDGWARMIYALAFYAVFEQPELLYTLVPKLLVVLLLGEIIIHTASYKTTTKLQVMALCLTSVAGAGAIYSLLTPYFTNRTALIAGEVIIGTMFYAMKAVKMSAIDEQEQKSGDNTWFYWAAVTVSSIIICFFAPIVPDKHLAYAAIVGGMALLLPTRMLQRIGKGWSFMGQKIEMLYEGILTAPLRLAGRLLWLAFDFRFVERGIAASLSGGGKLLGEKLQYWQENTPARWMFFLIAGGAAILVYIGATYYE